MNGNIWGGHCLIFGEIQLILEAISKTPRNWCGVVGNNNPTNEFKPGHSRFILIDVVSERESINRPSDDIVRHDPELNDTKRH